MRLHILPDQKIIDRTIETFEHVYPNDNKYIVISSTGTFKYVSVDKNNIYPFTSVKSNDFWRAVGDVSNYSSIIIHYLTNKVPLYGLCVIMTLLLMKTIMSHDSFFEKSNLFHQRI